MDDSLNAQERRPYASAYYRHNLSRVSDKQQLIRVTGLAISLVLLTACAGTVLILSTPSLRQSTAFEHCHTEVRNNCCVNTSVLLINRQTIGEQYRCISKVLQHNEAISSSRGHQMQISLCVLNSTTNRDDYHTLSSLLIPVKKIVSIHHSTSQPETGLQLSREQIRNLLRYAHWIENFFQLSNSQLTSASVFSG